MSAESSGEELDELRGEYDGNALWRLFREYGRDELPQFVIGGLASVLSRSMELVPAFVLGVVVDAVFFDTRLFQLPLLPAAWVPASDDGQLVVAVVIIGGAYLVGSVTNWVNNWAWNHFAQHLQHAVRTDTYDAIQERERSFFDDKQTGEVMSILNNDVNQLEDFLTTRLNSLIRIVVRVGGMGLVMLLLNWQLALIPVVVIPVLAGASYVFVSVIHPKYQDVRSTVGSLNARLENNLGGIEVIKANSKEDFESDRVEDASEDYLDAQWDAIETRIKYFPALRLITSAGYVATLFVGGLWVVYQEPPLAAFSGTLTAGTLVTFLLYTRRFVYPMRQFGQIINEYQYAQAAAERIVGLLDRSPKIGESPDATELADVEGRVEYDGVSFTYEGADERSLDNVSFTVEPGEMVGVVGPTGAGKTTLLKLLLRFYDVDEQRSSCPSEAHSASEDVDEPAGSSARQMESDDVDGGAVRVDGHDVRDVTLDSLREHVSYVSQEPYLFYGTVRENIAYGEPHRGDDAIREAAKLAGAHEFVSDLPEGYDTEVGERGVKLSGGQRQRLSIARAILRDPDVLVLDEATSHVDNETEILIQESLDQLAADRTTFAIAHRLSTVRDADRILVLDDGRLVEEGTHEELLERDGLYANLWSVQVGEVEDLPEEFVQRAVDRDDVVTD